MGSKLKPTSVKPTPSGKFPVLISYAMVKESPIGPRDFEMLVKSPHTEVLLDSGAFTALNAGKEILLEEYMEFLKEWEDQLFGYLALDVLGDPAGTDANLQVMLNDGLKPIPVHVRGDEQARMDQLFGWSDWVALGGLRRPHVGWSSKSYVKQKMLWAQGRNVHWLGYTNQGMVRGFKPYSCDCSNWSSGARWGTFQTYLGDWQWKNYGNISDVLKKPFSKRELEIFETIGFDAYMLRDKRYWRGLPDEDGVIDYRTHAAFMVTADSWVRYIRDMRSKVGTRAFLAATPVANHVEILLELIERTAA